MKVKLKTWGQLRDKYGDYEESGNILVGEVWFNQYMEDRVPEDRVISVKKRPGGNTYSWVPEPGVDNIGWTIIPEMIAEYITTDKDTPKKTFLVTFSDEIEAASEEDAYDLIIDMCRDVVNAADVTAFEFKEIDNESEV